METGYTKRPVRGFTLVELMIAMLLGLLIIAGVISIFIANKQSYRTNQALGQVQDSSRIAFELLARDIRGAGGTPCGNPSDRVANVVNYATSTANSFADWRNAIVGYDNTGTVNDPNIKGINSPTGGTPVADSDSVQLMGAGLANGLAVVSQHQNAANFKISANTPDFQGGDIIMVCDPDHATILQISNYNGSNVTVEYNSGTGNPGNCSKGLGFPTIPANCGADQNANGNGYEFGVNSNLAKLDFYDWYIGTNAAGGRSLYRVQMVNNAGVPGIGSPQEMVRGITNMQLTYHKAGTDSFVPASDSSITVAGNPTQTQANWLQVDSVRVTLTAQSTAQRATTGKNPQPLQRTFTATVTLRNRVN